MRKTYDTPQVAEMFGVTHWTYNRMVREGRAPVMPINNTDYRRRYSVTQVHQVLGIEVQS